MRRLLLTLVALMITYFAVAQDSHGYYVYSHTNYRTESGNLSSNRNLSSTTRLPIEFTLSIPSDHKLLWLDSPAREMKFEAGTHEGNILYFHYIDWGEDRLLQSLAGQYEMSENDIMISIRRDYSRIVVTYAEFLPNDMYRNRMDVYTRSHSGSAPNNELRRKHEQEERERFTPLTIKPTLLKCV